VPLATVDALVAGVHVWQHADVDLLAAFVLVAVVLVAVAGKVPVGLALATVGGGQKSWQTQQQTMKKKTWERAEATQMKWN
jgi:hypothetical protein